MAAATKTITTTAISDALDEMRHTIDLIGIRETLNALKKARGVALLPTNKTDAIEYVITCVSDVVQINRKDIFESREKTDERKIAVAMIVYHLKKNFGFSFAEIRSEFEKLGRKRKQRDAYFQYETISKANLLNPISPFEKKLKGWLDQSITIIKTDK